MGSPFLFVAAAALADKLFCVRFANWLPVNQRYRLQMLPLRTLYMSQYGGVLSSRLRAEKIPGFCRRGVCGEVTPLISRRQRMAQIAPVYAMFSVTSGRQGVYCCK
jgi:hypothetical protein